MDNLSLAKKKLTTSSYSLVVIKNNQLVAHSKDQGVGGILNLYETEPEILANSYIGDKIIGRAVAMICELGEVNSCYTPLLSRGAEEILTQAEINYEADKIVPAIQNKDNTGLCPIEQLTLEANNSREGIQKIKKFLQK
jgi:hypothetical protein